jgi:hypothetical protein
MKTKKSEKKMKLTKITVTNLSTREMHQVMGGGEPCSPMTLGCTPSIDACTCMPHLAPGTSDSTLYG